MKVGKENNNDRHITAEKTCREKKWNEKEVRQVMLNRKKVSLTERLI